MCTSVKSPTPKTPDVPDPIYMHNPWLDGLGISGEARGRNSLRIDLGSPVPTPGSNAGTPPTSPVPRPVIPPSNPNAVDPNTPVGIRNVLPSAPVMVTAPGTGGPSPASPRGTPTTGGNDPASPRGTPTTGGPAPVTKRRAPGLGGPAPVLLGIANTGGNAPRSRLGIGR